MVKLASYITHPQRIYNDPNHPEISDYVEVIPKTTSDAVMLEGSTSTLTEILRDIGGPRIDVRNTTIRGEDIVKGTLIPGVNKANYENAISSGQYGNLEDYLRQAFDGQYTSDSMWWSKQLYEGYCDGLDLYGYTGSDGNNYFVDSEIDESKVCNYLVNVTASDDWNTGMFMIDGLDTKLGDVILTRNTDIDVTNWSGLNYPPSRIMGNAYIGNKNLTDKITKVRISQPPYESACVSSVIVQYSPDNGTTWQNLGTYELTVKGDYSEYTELLLPDYTPTSTYALRVLANSDVGGSDSRYPSWQVVELEFLTQDSLKLQVGNFVATIANGYTDEGIAVNTRHFFPEYTDLDLPDVNSNFLLLNQNNEFFFSRYFDGGRDFPSNPIEGQIFFHNQLRQAYKFTNETWEPHPCVALARFEAGKLAEILPFNTWWWDEIIWENMESDLPAGMEVNVYNDVNNNSYFLKVGKGSVVDNGEIYTLTSDIYKNVQVSFERGDSKGSNDGSYVNISNPTLPINISSTTATGYSVQATENVEGVYSCLNPDDNGVTGWVVSSYPASFTVSFPLNVSKSINKYEVKSPTSDVSTFIKSWNLLGSKDGINWEVIDHVSDAGFLYGDTTKEFYTSNNNKYSFIKFVVLNNNGGGDATTSVAYIRFFTSVPELGVFVITDGESTDVLTSTLDGPALPNGYLNYHKIGTICLRDTSELFNPFPTKTFAKDMASQYEYISNKLVLKANADMSNLSQEGLMTLANMSTPRLSNQQIKLSNNVVYKADVTSGSVLLYTSDGTRSIYVGASRDKVANSEKDTVVYSSSVTGSASGIVRVPKGYYYKIIYTGTLENSAFIPDMAYGL